MCIYKLFTFGAPGEDAMASKSRWAEWWILGELAGIFLCLYLLC